MIGHSDRGFNIDLKAGIEPENALAKADVRTVEKSPAPVYPRRRVWYHLSPSDFRVIFKHR